MGLYPVDGNDEDHDGLSDYDELITYHSNPNVYSTAGDMYSDYYKVQNSIPVDEFREGYHLDGNEFSEYVDVKPNTNQKAATGIVREIIDFPEKMGISSAKAFFTENLPECEVKINLNAYGDNYEAIVYDFRLTYVNIKKCHKNKEEIVKCKTGPYSTAFIVVPEKSVNLVLTKLKVKNGKATPFRIIVNELSKVKFKNEKIQLFYEECLKFWGLYNSNSDFDIKKDTFAFKNFNSNISPDGNCIGIASITAKTYNHSGIEVQNTFVNIDGNTYSYNIKDQEIYNYIKENNLHAYKDADYINILEGKALSDEKDERERINFINFIGYYWFTCNANINKQITPDYFHGKYQFYNENKIKEIINCVNKDEVPILIFI